MDPVPLSLDEYLRATRRRSFGVLTVIGLLALYEAGIVLTAGSERNAADLMIKDALEALGDHGARGFHLALLAAFVGAAAYCTWRGRHVARYLPLFCVETALYAVMLSPVVLLLREPFLARGLDRDLVLDVGAGVYEEIVFRLLVIQSVFAFVHTDPWHTFLDEDRPEGEQVTSRVPTAAFAVLLSTVLFAAYHHVGAGAEPWSAAAFGFRCAAGAFLALIYFTRGLAAAVYTHAFYDLFIHFSATS